MIDDSGKNSQFCLTGSRQFEIMDRGSQSLAGRTSMLKLMPFSLSELKTIKHLENADEVIFTGFYPRIHDQGLVPGKAHEDYINTYIERDLRSLSAIQDLYLFQKFMKLLAGRTGQILNMSSIANDCGISNTIAKKWLSLLEASYIVFLLQPFYRNISKRLIKSPKVYFFDTGLAAHLMGIEKSKHLETHPLTGNLFENLVVADVLKERLHNGLRNNLYFYRDSKGNEIDLCYEEGHQLKIIEIKKGATINSDYFKGLNHFNDEFNDMVMDMYLVYNGDFRGKRNNINVCGMNEIASLLL